MAWSTASKSMSLCLSDLFWPSRFLQPEGNFLNYPVTVQWSNVPSPFAPEMFFFPQYYGSVGTCKVPELDYVARSSAKISIYMQSEGMRDVSAHQLPRYF